MRSVFVTPEVQRLLDAGAPVAVGMSGGKDSHAAAWAMAKLLKGYRGPKLLVHADLGVVEWDDSFPACQRIADRIGWELVTVQRAAGGMMERWESRWQSSMDRYSDLRTVTVVLPWSTPALRFCTSELKVDPITAYLKRRFGKVPILNVTGVRGEESTQRAKQPVCGPGAKLPDDSRVWRPIHQWTLADVWEAIAESGVAPHEAYSKFGSSRVSCRFCILASDADLRASLSDPAALAIYRRMCSLELASGFSFQAKWLTALGPEFIPNGGAKLLRAVQLARWRGEAELWLKDKAFKHLQFTKGWPHCVPSDDECARLAIMRRKILDLYAWGSPYVTQETVKDRYRELLAEKHAREAVKAAAEKRKSEKLEKHDPNNN